jgi:glycine cleavage system H lipoate-binding protein
VFPWNYGFVWNTGHVIFLGAFYAVLAILAVTVLRALNRSRRDLQTHQTDQIRWHSDFEDLLSRDRVCRHVLTGEFRERQCPHAFDCRECETHAKLVARRPVPAPPEREEDICGMVFPLDRFYHRGHTWTRLESDGTVTIGLDDLGKRLVGSPDALDLPAPGTRIHANGAAFHFRRRGADVRVLAPVDGEVLAVGGDEDGWFLKVRPDAAGELGFRHLLRGAEIAPWIMREMERLQLALCAGGAAATLADGGVPVADIAAGYPEADWGEVCGEMFLEP